jgi:NAD(P)-dependent dehydrogenase (short-subunit alcohol dehydrogenase family)
MSRTDDSDVPSYSELGRLDGRGYVVMGAGQGIGRQVCHALASVGAKVLCVDWDIQLAEDVAGEVGGVPFQADVTKRDQVEAAFDRAVSEFGRIEGAVDIVGLAHRSSLVELSDSNWDSQFDIVLRHAFFTVQTGAQVMAGSGGGVIVLVASVAGMTAAPARVAYGAAKAGLISLVKTAAVELGPSNVRVNAVAPGVVLTPRIFEFLGERGRRQNAANVPLGRCAVPADIASCVLFLASDLSGFVNGQTLVVDGGVGVKDPYPEPDQ